VWLAFWPVAEAPLAVLELGHLSGQCVPGHTVALDELGEDHPWSSRAVTISPRRGSGCTPRLNQAAATASVGSLTTPAATESPARPRQGAGGGQRDERARA
jgi:hypothetical protein